MKRLLSFILPGASALSVFSAEVHITEQTSFEGVTNVVAENTSSSLWKWRTVNAPEVANAIFTHWKISTAQAFENRDEWGRALDQVSFVVYEDTTLTACYVPKTLDEDGDGVADGHELYWYGNLSQGPNSDTDDDGVSFAAELAAGRNPLMAETADAGPIVWVAGAEWLFNPNDYGAVTIRSEPEGLLFATTSEVYRPGTRVSTTSKGTYSPETTTFAYWSFNGERLADEWGRAEAEKTVVTDGSPLTFVAYAASDYETRMKLYWYGTTDVAMMSDTDGDGKTFAEELAAGTNPLMAETKDEGPVRTTDGVLWQYNPYNYQPYTVKSNPEGALFPTESYYVRAGTKVVVSAPGSSFYGWQVNGGEIRRDEWGRSEDAFTFTMPGEAVTLVAKTASDYETRMKLYWYGTTEVAMTSDTDGDGKTFADELAADTNPLMAEAKDEGPIKWADTETKEFNLQPYEQVTGAVVDGKYEVFPTFDGAVTPTVVDIDGDGKFDIVVEVEGGETVVYLGCGSDGNPEFRKVAWRGEWAAALAAAKPRSLEGLEFDVNPPVDLLSWSFADVDGDGIKDLLVSDKDGRIWYYHATSTPPTDILQHKVWGGSFDGFAQGLRIAVVDWDGDGDVDLVCGTAEGKLMLLNDPRMGRPVNVRAETGVDSVVLSWDPSINSRVRGYGVYRSADSNNYDTIASLWTLPRYRDCPETLQDYYYRVTSKSRLYTAGNSTPVESESVPTDAVYVQFRPNVWLNDTSSFTETNVEVVVSMNNSMGISSSDFSMTFEYDPDVLEPVEIKTTGLTEGMTFEEEKVGGGGQRNWIISATGGEIGIGSGRFLRLVFYVKPVHDITETTVSITAATVKTMDGRAVTLNLPKSAKIEISDSHPIVPAVYSVHVDDAAVETEADFELGVQMTSTETLTNLVADVVYDGELLELRGVVGGALSGSHVVCGGNNFALQFYAKDPNTVLTNLSTVVSLKNIVAIDHNNFEVKAAEAKGTILLKNVHPWVAARVSVATEDKKADTLTEVVIPFFVTVDQSLASGVFTIEYDPAVLEYLAQPNANGRAVISAAGDFAATFLVKDLHDVERTQVSLSAASVTDIHGFTVSPETPVVSTILIHDAHPLVPAKVSMTLADVAAKTENDFEMMLSIATTEALASLDMEIAYDTSLLTFLSGQLKFTDGVPSSVTYRFHAKENHTIDKTVVTITPKSGVDHNNLAAELPAKVEGTVILADSNPWQPATVSVSIDSKKVDTLTEFTLPVTITSNEKLVDFNATVEYDADILELRGAEGAALTGTTLKGTGASFALKFFAKNQHTTTRTNVRLVDMSATDNHGLAANPIANSLGAVLINDAHPLVPAGVAMNVSKVYADTRSEFSLPIVVTSTKVLTDLTVAVGWDSNVLELKGVTQGTMSGNTLSVSGTVPSILYLTFYAKDQHTVSQTTVTLSGASAHCIDGLAAKITTVNGNVYLTDTNKPVPVTMTVATWHTKVKSGETFDVPIGATTSGDLATLTVDVDWDATQLTFNGCASAKSITTLSSNSRRIVFDCTGNYNLFNLSFTAPTISGLQASSWTRVISASGVGRNELAAVVETELPQTGEVMIVREIGKFGPGDLDGDGAYTSTDTLILNGYVVYLKMAAMGANFGAAFVNSYKAQYGVDVVLTGSAAKAADVNGDGKVDSSDIAMLEMFVKEAEGVGK